ncbi:uncharacterized WD repeat-containing protein C25H1.08c-like, partial [Hordeum vulgare subsp. vulgare]|uniref:uncharacterized WD repeat-containing protein C25H1.08c-like n=1 Tax=Hordeum vulgare subsp. vulgare TaxID=112509 RepID=UPI001D1A3C84
FAAACSPVDASLVVSRCKDDRGFLWKIGSAEDVQELPGHNDTVSTMAFSSDGKLVACGSMDGQINVWNTATRTLQGTLEGSESGFEVRLMWKWGATANPYHRGCDYITRSRDNDPSQDKPEPPPERLSS